MLLRILLLAGTVYGAAIPQNPTCLEKCLVAGGIVGAAADLNFFKSVAVDINNFCNVYTALLKCASGCSQDDLNLVMKHTMHASYVCKEKLEEIKTVHDCLESDQADPLSDCSKVCEVTEHVPLRLDSTATAPVNPNVPAEGTGPLCGKQMCVLKCAREQLNKQCAGAGDLFKEIARHQVEIGWDNLQAQSENTNDTASQLVALSYLANIPEKCVYLTNLETFDKEIGGDMLKKPEMMPGMEFSNDTAVEHESPGGALAAAMDGVSATLDKIEGVVHEQPKPADAPAAAEADESTDEAAESTDASADKEAVMGTRPVVTPSPDGFNGGLKASRPVTEADKDKEEDMSGPGHPIVLPKLPTDISTLIQSRTRGGSAFSTDTASATATASGEMAKSTDTPSATDMGSGEMAKSSDTASSSAEAKSEEKVEGATEEGGAMEGATSEDATTMAVDTSKAMEGKTEEAEKTEDAEMTDEMGSEVEKEVEETGENKDSTGAEMTTESTIVVDDENESELETNVVTEKAKVNGAPALSFLTALFALASVLFI